MPGFSQRFTSGAGIEISISRTSLSFETIVKLSQLSTVISLIAVCGSNLSVKLFAIKKKKREKFLNPIILNPLSMEKY